MLEDVTLLDFVAALWFLVAWIGYVQTQNLSPNGLNRRMDAVRRAWMEQLLGRDIRIMDSALVGHSLHSITFFASTTMLIVGGLIGLLGAIDQIHDVLRGISFAVRTGRDFVELKLLALIGAFGFAFFQFTWALRQNNYLCALIGAAPPHDAAPERRAAAAQHMGQMLSLAVSSYNGGLRAYYFALALVAWFVHPIAFMAMTALVLGVLLRRQHWSRTSAAIREMGGALDRSDKPK